MLDKVKNCLLIQLMILLILKYFSFRNCLQAAQCRALFAWRVWTLTAIPAILYGCEAVLIRQTELSEIEKTQATVAKFMLQVPSSTTNVVAQVLADMELIETI